MTPGYADLTPEFLLDALEAVGLNGDGRVLQLNSFENRVFQVFLDDGRVVVAKFYRPARWSDAQILEEHAFALELAAAEVPVVPPLVLEAARPGVSLRGSPATLAEWGSYRFAVALRQTGREPELEEAGVLERLGMFLGRLHTVGRQRPFEHRHRMQPARDAHRAIDVIAASGHLPPEQSAAWQRAADAALDGLESAFEAHGPLATLRLHGDCHLGNLLWRDGAPHLVDLDDAMQGPAVQDLWMLVSGDALSMSHQFDRLLEGYLRFSAFDERERRLVEPLRTLRMLRHSAWLAERWADPAFPLAFPHFGSAAYWSQQATQLREQLEAMDA